MAQKVFMPDLSRTERIRVLKENSDRSEETAYVRDLTEEEIEDRRIKLVENFIAIQKKDEELKEARDAHKMSTDPLKKQNKFMASEVRLRKTTATGTLFFMANHQEGMMEIYNEDGLLVEERRLRPEERQGRLYLADGVKLPETASGS